MTVVCQAASRGKGHFPSAITGTLGAKNRSDAPRDGQRLTILSLVRPVVCCFCTSVSLDTQEVFRKASRNVVRRFATSDADRD
jgi:hypothetical protein